MQVLDERGYVVLAVNSPQVDYVTCAQRLARSIRYWHPDAKICLVTDCDIQDSAFDHVRLLVPNVDNPYANDSCVWGLSPFRQTIKLEADMLITSSIDHWWDMLQHRDLVISTGCRDFYDQPATSRFYRRVFDDNQLPDVYNAITYWRVCAASKHFFQLVQNIFENWSQFRTLLKFSDDVPSTDLVYAIAAQITGPEQVTMPFASYPCVVHMKQHMISCHTSDWTQELVWETDQAKLRIGTVAQWGAVHYHVKDWACDEQ